jgi:arabinooligosaccharide transport system permease protein
MVGRYRGKGDSASFRQRPRTRALSEKGTVPIFAVAAYVVLSAVAVAVLTPLLWTIISSFRPSGELFSGRFSLKPETFTLDNYVALFRPLQREAGGQVKIFPPVPYSRYFLNSLFVSTSATLLSLFFCSLGGYGFAKYSFRGKQPLFAVLLGSMMIPFHVALVPLYVEIARFGWTNSFQALIVPGAAGAFGIFLMRQYMASVPSDLVDAARIDGCSEFGIYWRVALPIVKPALGAMTIMLFMFHWNDFLWPSMVLFEEAKFTLPVGLKSLISTYDEEYGVLLAGTTLGVLPVIALFLWMQKEFVEGITLGAVKE